MTVVARDDTGRPTEWQVTAEPEFDATERDAWEALAEWRNAVCDKCGNLTAICSNPLGLTGEGYHLKQTVCWPTAIEEATRRRVDRMYGKEQPDPHGFKTPDGVMLAITLTDPGTEDVLGLEEQQPELSPLFGPQQPNGQQDQPGE